MKIVASAPTKVIITGEHAVVHGAPALAMPVERRNRITLKTTPGAGVYFQNMASTDWYWKSGPGREYEGQPVYKGLRDEMNHVLAECKTSLGQLGFALKAELDFSNSPKGTGNSASIAASWALALYSLLSAHPSTRQLFETVQVAENVTHGNPSGIDARTVLAGTAQIFQKRWAQDGSVSYKFTGSPLQLPLGTTLFVAQAPLGSGEKELFTGDMVAKFSQTLVGKGPNDLSAADRARITAPFLPVASGIMREMHSSGNSGKLGELFAQNNELLRKGGVVPDSMQKVIDLCITEGAFGAKGTGACGPGGAVLVFCSNGREGHLFRALKKRGINALRMPPAKKAARVESREE